MNEAAAAWSADAAAGSAHADVLALGRTAMAAASAAASAALAALPFAVVGSSVAENISCYVTERSSGSGALVSVVCEGATLTRSVSENILPSDPRFWIYVTGSVVLVVLAGIMSGLTIGLVSLDETTLTVLRNSGTPEERRHAERVLPLVKRHHLLLVTLLLANALCMEALPLLLDQLASPAVAIAVSVTAVLFFGEIIPQALCTRYGIAIGANLAYLVWAVLGLLFVVSWPISKLLDWIFGAGHATYFRRNQLTELVNLHGAWTVRRRGGGGGRVRRGTVFARVRFPRASIFVHSHTLPSVRPPSPLSSANARARRARHQDGNPTPTPTHCPWTRST